MPAPARVHIGGETKGHRHFKDFNEIVIGGAEQEAMRVEFWIAKQIGTDLMRTYPNREWHVDVDCKNQVVIVSCPSLSKRMGYRLHMKRDTVAGLIPRCRRAAGEILERFGASRSRIITPDTFENYDRNLYDDCIAHDSQTDIASKL
jgi:hypothetical protein